MTSGDVAGPPPWRIAAALTVVAALATALVLVSRSPDSGEPDAARAVATVPPATAPAGVTTSRPSPGALQPEPGDVLPALDAALAAWGEFAATGDLSLLDATFASAGPQLAQLATEAPAIAADPPGPPPYSFEVVEHGGATTEDGVAEVVATVRVTRPGEEAATFRWKVELRWDPAPARWQLWTVTSLDG